MRPSSRVRYIRNGEDHKVEDRQGEWQRKVVLVISGMKCEPVEEIADPGPIHPRTNQDRPALPVYHLSTRNSPGLEPGITCALLPGFLPYAKLEHHEDGCDLCDDCSVRGQQRH